MIGHREITFIQQQDWRTKVQQLFKHFVMSVAVERKNFQITKHLELLADFRTYVFIQWMKARQFHFFQINIRERKIFASQRLHHT
jgi:hypothetical protein